MSKLALALIAVNLIGVGTGATYMFMALSEPLVKQTKKADLAQMSTEEYLVYHNIFADKPIIYSLDPFTVNLANVDEDKKVLVEVNLELNDEKSFQEVMTQSAAVRDAVVTILSKREQSEIATIQGKLFLKEDIAVAVNKHLKNTLIKGVYFTKFFVE
jgi:flagellar basal body-associated protein FliL